MGGYTLITADDLNAAVAMAATCPALGYRGGVEIGELVELNRASAGRTPRVARSLTPCR